MTLDEIRAIPKEMLTPADVAPYLGCAPYSINCQARHDERKLGFAVSVMGARVRIPKAAFIAWAEGKNKNGGDNL